jgi:hypothetical protein
MTECFYSINHLSTERLRELYRTYRSRGWVDFDYYKLMPAGVHPPELSDAEILLNIDAEVEKNYFVLMLDHEDEEDGVMIGFGMSYYPDFGAYLHLPPELLNELAEKYALHVYREAKDCHSWTEFLAEERFKNSLN